MYFLDAHSRGDLLLLLLVFFQDLSWLRVIPFSYKVIVLTLWGCIDFDPGWLAAALCLLQQEPCGEVALLTRSQGRLGLVTQAVSPETTSPLSGY